MELSRRPDRYSALLFVSILTLGVPALAQTTACGFCEIGPVSEAVFDAPPGVSLTVDPAGTGDRLEDLGITLKVRIQCPNSANQLLPVSGIPGEEILLFDARLCMVLPMSAAQPTDAAGWTEFSGTFRAGGCTDRIRIFADGAFLAEVPLRINSPDTGTSSPCAVDAGDLSALAYRLGIPSRYDFCFDYNDDGAIDCADLSRFAMSLPSSP